MSPARAVPLLALAAALALPAAGASAAKRPAALKVAVPAAGQVSVVLADAGRRASRPKAAAVPAGVSVLGGVTPAGRLAVAVVRPRDAAAGGRVTVKLKRRPRGVERLAAALDGGGAPKAACKDAKLGAALGRRLAGAAAGADAKALGALLAGRLCGRPADAAVLERLGLGAAAAPAPAFAPAPAPPAAAGRPLITLASGGSGGGGGGGGTSTPNQCSNGIDDDGDGQVDFGTNRNVMRPDPGCAGSTDDEAGEAAVSEACARLSGVSRGTEDRDSAFAAINADCGDFQAFWVNVPGIANSCTTFTSRSNFACNVEQGDAVARSMDGTPTDQADTLIQLGTSLDCAVPATIALIRPDGSVAELVEPVGGCDDDGGGPAGELPAGCTPSGATYPDPTVISVTMKGCGSVEGIAFTPPGTPEVCAYQLGDGAAQDCTVDGPTVRAAFGATQQDVTIATRLAAAPECGRQITIALRLAGGRTVEYRNTWCD